MPCMVEWKEKEPSGVWPHCLAAKTNPNCLPTVLLFFCLYLFLVTATTISFQAIEVGYSAIHS